MVFARAVVLAEFCGHENVNCAMLASAQYEYSPTTRKVYFMKKLLLICATACFVQPVWAANNIDLTGLGQTTFKEFSEDLGSALSYKPVTPPAPLGITGFPFSNRIGSMPPDAG